MRHSIFSFSLLGWVLTGFSAIAADRGSIVPTWEDFVRPGSSLNRFWEKDAAHPDWENQQIALIDLRLPRVSQEKGQDEGILSKILSLFSSKDEEAGPSHHVQLPLYGREVLSLYRPPSFEKFEEVLKKDGFEGDTREAYRQFLKEFVLERGLPIVALNKILEFFADRAGLAETVSEEIADYVAQSLLVQYAADTRRVRTRQVDTFEKNEKGEPIVEIVPDVAIYDVGLRKLYGWFRDDVDGKDWSFRPDWRYRVRGLEEGLKAVRASKVQFPSGEDGFELKFCQPPLREACVPVTGPRELAWAIANGIVYEEMRARGQETRLYRELLAKKFEKSLNVADRATLRNKKDPALRRLVSRTVERALQDLGVTTPDRSRLETYVYHWVRDEDYRRFRNQIRRKLQEIYPALRLKTIWNALVLREVPTIVDELQFAVTREESDRIYRINIDKFADPASRTMRFEVVSLDVKGESSQAFVEFFARGLKPMREKAINDFIEAARKTDRTDRKAVEALEKSYRIARIAAWTAAYAEAVQKHEGDIQAGRISAVLKKDRELRYSAAVGSKDDPSLDARELQYFMMQAGGEMSPDPIFVGQLGDTTRVSMVAKTDLRQEMLPQDDPRVENALRSQILNKVQADAYRRTALRLFSKYRVHWLHNPGSHSAWPTARFEPVRWADALTADLRALSMAFELSARNQK